MRPGTSTRRSKGRCRGAAAGLERNFKENAMDRIERLEAIEEIRNLKARYFRAIDEKDEALLREVFANDVELDYRGSTTDPATGINAAHDATGDVIRGGEHAARQIAASLAGLNSVHHGVEPEIEIVDAEHASGIWPMVDRLRFPPGAPFSEMTGYGHYRETYVRERGRWRIRTLRLTRLRIDFTPA
jgi:ketosteroid isomerase-like protein